MKRKENAARPTGPVEKRIERLEARVAPATFTVTTLADAGEGSLRSAIESANQLEGADNIVFTSGLHGSVKLKSGLPVIVDDLAIDGPLAKAIAINGSKKFPLFQVTGTDLEVSISNLKLTGGLAESGAALRVDAQDSTVTIDSCILTKNTAVGPPGQGEKLEGGLGKGGAITVENGSLIIAQSIISGNRAIGGKGSIVKSSGDYGDYVYVYGGGPARGGGVFVGANGSATISNSKITGNQAQPGKVFVYDARGGGVYSAGLLVINEKTEVTKNTVKGASEAAGGGVSNVGTATIISATISKNSVGAVPKSSGTKVIGGGIHNSGTLEIQDSIISGNMAKTTDGYNGGNGSKGEKGAKGAKGANGGRGEDGEDGEEGSSGGSGYEGGYAGDGGDALGGGVFNSGNLSLVTSTISGNRLIAGDGGNGGKGGNGGAGGKGGNGGNGGKAFRYQGERYAAGYGGSGGNGGYGGSGGTGANGGAGGDALGAGVFNSYGSLFTNTSTISGNLAKAGVGGKGGAGGAAGAGGAGGMKGLGRAPSSGGGGYEYDERGYDYSYGSRNGHKGEKGEKGSAGEAGSNGNAVADLFTDTTPPPPPPEPPENAIAPGFLPMVNFDGANTETVVTAALAASTIPQVISGELIHSLMSIDLARFPIQLTESFASSFSETNEATAASTSTSKLLDSITIPALLLDAPS